MALTVDEIVVAINASGVTIEQLTALLSKSAIIESKEAEIARKQTERDAALAVYDGEIRALTVELNTLQAQAQQQL